MILGIGTDLVQISRIEEMLKTFGSSFENKVFTDLEQKKAASLPQNKRASFYAKRFAAKEAVYKAFSPETMDEITWHDAEIMKRPNGKPVMKLNGKLAEIAEERGLIAENIDVSLSHDEVYATATVVINK